VKPSLEDQVLKPSLEDHGLGPHIQAIPELGAGYEEKKWQPTRAAIGSE
jgi:hypothetical protein